jgi:D-alanyl-D-alanine carboxypeptidase
MKNIIRMLLISLVFSVTSCSDSNAENSISLVNNNQKNIVNNIQKNTSDIQSLANNFLNKYKLEDDFSAVSVTAQCNKFNNGNPITVYAGTMGYNNSNPITDDSVWQIGSNTKSFTSIVLLQLEDEYKDKFSIDDDITKWFPEYTYWQDSITHKGATIRQLMNMTSGIPGGETDQFFSDYGKDPFGYIKPEKMINYADKHLLFTPGNGYIYSNTNYHILSQLIQKITQKDYHGKDAYQTEITERIIDKLKLKHTYVVRNLSTEFVNKNNIVSGCLNATNPTNDCGLSTLSWTVGSGEIISTTADINKYYRILYTTNQLLTSSQLKKLASFVENDEGTHPGQPIASPELASNHDVYGLGIGALSFTNNLAAPYHNIQKHINNYQFIYRYMGATFGFVFYYVYNPINSASVVVSENSYKSAKSHITNLTYDVLNYLDDKCN